MSAPTVYLAGPMVFDPDPDAIFAEMKAICARHGLRGVSPLDGQVSIGNNEPGHALATDIVSADIALMRSLDAGLFCLDGFRRGPEMDPGTAFEIGFMSALGKPLAGWTRDVRDYPARVRDYFLDRGDPAPTKWPASGLGATSGTLRDLDGILVHSEGCFQNAMTQIGIEKSGGRVVAHADWRRACDVAVASLADVMLERGNGRRAIG